MTKSESIALPSLNFVSPESILACEYLSTEEKERALLNWKSDCEELERSADEGMSGKTKDVLSLVMKSLIKLRTKIH